MSAWSRRLGPRTRLGALGGLSANQAIIAGAGVLGTLTVLSEMSGSPLALPVAIMVAAATAGMVLVHRWGMPMANWTLKATAHKTGRKVWHARPVGQDVEQLPRELRGVQIVPVRDRAALVGMFRDERAMVAVAKLDLHSLGLFDHVEQARRLDAFKRIMDDLARTHNDPEYRVQLMSRHTPRRANGARDYVTANVADAKVDSPQAQAMLEVIDNTEAASHDDEFYVVIRQSAKTAEQTAARLIERLRSLMERLERAEIAIRTTRQPLEPRELARLIKDSYDPFGRHVRDQLERATQMPGTDPAAAWPEWRVRHVDAYETDGAQHATLWMRGWPATEVAPGWLKPLTLECDVPAMTVSTVLKPEEKGKAAGLLRRKATRTGSLTLFRHKHGQDDRVEHSARDEYLQRQTQELHSGATPWWWEMYVTVSALDGRQLEESVRKVESACVECGLTPVLLRWGQADAFTFTLPLGRGLEPEKARL